MPELIDRQALIKDMCNNKTEAKCPCYPNCYPCDFSEARRIIDIQPTIEPEAQHGRWVVNDRNPDYADCTNCGLSEWLGANGSRDYAETLLSGFKKFCPNCGAKMDGGADNG